MRGPVPRIQIIRKVFAKCLPLALASSSRLVHCLEVDEGGFRKFTLKFQFRSVVIDHTRGAKFIAADETSNPDLLWMQLNDIAHIIDSYSSLVCSISIFCDASRVLSEKDVTGYNCLAISR